MGLSGWLTLGGRGGLMSVGQAWAWRSPRTSSSQVRPGCYCNTYQWPPCSWLLTTVVWWWWGGCRPSVGDAARPHTRQVPPTYSPTHLPTYMP